MGKEWEKANQVDRDLLFDSGRNKMTWLSYQDPAHREGRDDITTVNILQGHNASLNVERVIVGRASGELVLLRLNENLSTVERKFDTGRSLVRSADIGGDRSHLLAACLGDARAVLYDLSVNQEGTKPVSEVHCVNKTEHKCRTWSARFLSNQRLAIGRGVSDRLVYVYEVTPSGLTDEPIRAFGSGRAVKQAQTSAYPLCSIPQSTEDPGFSNDVFLSGGYDGMIRLHDMRSPSDCETFITDPTDTAPVFSLLMVGRERIVAGGAINSLLKVFDIRMPGGRAYSYLDINEPDSRPPLQQENSYDHGEGDSTSAQRRYPYSGFNIFASPQHEVTSKWPRRTESSPIYSLSRPSSSSSSLYVGLEGSVLHFNMTSMLDKHPDPVFNPSLIRRRNGEVDAVKTWDPLPKDKVVRLSMYEQTESGSIPLRVQGPVGFPLNRGEGLPGYDERWFDVNGR